MNEKRRRINYEMLTPLHFALLEQRIEELEKKVEMLEEKDKVMDIENGNSKRAWERGEKTLDESPDAYKDIIGVMELQKESVEVIKHLKPFINWKG
jgi:ribosomal protein L14E/L6E/L27E